MEFFFFIRAQKKILGQLMSNIVNRLVSKHPRKMLKWLSIKTFTNKTIIFIFIHFHMA